MQLHAALQARRASLRGSVGLNELALCRHGAERWFHVKRTRRLILSLSCPIVALQGDRHWVAL